MTFSPSGIENIYTPEGGSCSVYFANNYSTTETVQISDITFYNPIELSELGSILQVDVYQYGYYYHWVGYELYYAYVWFYIDVFFDDNTSFTIQTNNYISWNYWGTITVDLAQYAAQGKKVTRIAVRASGYMYNHCYGSWQWWYSCYSYIKGLRIINTYNQIEYQSNNIFFKVGSNYYKELAENGTAMLSAETGNIVNSSPSLISGMWFENNIVQIPSYVDDFSSTFIFKETPEETSNARLVLRYRDNNNNQVLGGLTIILEYWGGATYTLLDDKTLYISQDLLLTIPDGKYIKSITVSGRQCDFLNNVYIGQIQIYNNVPSATLSDLIQYPVLQCTAADSDRTHFTLMNINDIACDTSGYIMASTSGAYILPGTNVIRKQKDRPTFESDPALREGDIWLDYSKEPLIAYQYSKGEWRLFNDVPIGYVTLLWSDPVATTSIDATGITAASVVTSDFSQAVSGTGIYNFIYDGTGWYMGGNSVTLSDYGITYTGTPVINDKIIIAFTASSSTVQSLETYPYNQNGYNINAFTENIGSLSGRDGRDGLPGKDGKNGAPGAKGDPGIGIPTGGLQGQILAKASNADYITKWTTMASTALFDGGTAGQTLIKNSSDDLDFSWGNLSGLPSGGTTGQTIIKNSDSDNDVSWGTIRGVVAGGTTGQALVKLSNSDYNYGWQNVTADLSVAVNKSDFKLNTYINANSNNYTGILYEQFMNTSGINSTADDGAVVISTYYDSQKLEVNNTSGSAISFRLTAVSFDNATTQIQLMTESTGTVTYSISTDGGATFTALTANTPTMLSTTSLILKIELASLATIRNIAIMVR